MRGTRGLCVGLAAAAVFAPLASAGAPFTGDLIVQSQEPGALDFRIDEYRADGTVLQSFVPVRPPASTDQWKPRDLVMDEGGRVFLYNGTSDPYLSIYDPNAETWSHRTRAGWQTVEQPGYGGIARAGDRVFATDMSTARDLANGIVAFDVALGTSQQIAGGDTIDLTLGLDGKLWALSETSDARAFDPVTYAYLGTVSLAGSGAGVHAIAVGASGDFYAATNQYVAHLAPDGSLLGTLPLTGGLRDLDLAPDHRLAIGTYVDGVWLSDTGFASAQHIGAGRWNSFVAFVVPEPGTGALVALGLALLAPQRRGSKRSQ